MALDLPRARQSRSRVTRELIFQAGARLLEEGGAEALTVAAVAARAGVSVGSVYRRFGDKDRLLASLQADFTANFRAEIVRRFAGAPRAGDADPGELVTAAVTAVAEAFRAHQRLLLVFILLGTANEAVLREGPRRASTLIPGGVFASCPSHFLGHRRAGRRRAAARQVHAG